MLRRLSSLLIIAVVLAIVLPVIAVSALRGLSLVREVDGRASTAPKNGQYVAAADAQLFVQEAGPVYGTPVVLVHGPGAWSEMWRPTIKTLSEAGYRVIAPDLPPFGYSFRPANGDYSTEAQARRLTAMLDSMGLASAVLVAHSVNARAVVEVVLRDPGRARALVLVSADLGLQTPPGEDPGLPLRALLAVGPLRNAVLASSATNPFVTPLLVEQVAGKPLSLDRIDLLRKPMALTGTTEGLGLWMRQHLLSTENPASRQPLRYKDLAVPALLLWGTEDRVAPLHEAQHLASLLPAATLSTFSGVGHLLPLEDPLRLNTLLLDALQVMAPTPGGGQAAVLALR